MALHQTRRAATEPEARALASALRLRILRLCLDQALTNKEIAARLGLNPATTLHHVRTLVATGFLAAQPERRGARGAREVPYLSTGKSWTLDVQDAGIPGHREALIDAFLDEIRMTGPQDGRLSRLGLRLDKAQLQELQERVTALLDDFAGRPSDPEGQPYSVFVALYPDRVRE